MIDRRQAGRQTGSRVASSHAKRGLQIDGEHAVVQAGRRSGRQADEQAGAGLADCRAGRL
jgi:hypothetical protein